MKTAIVTGAAGLIGSQSVIRFASDGYHVVGIDNNMRYRYFGLDGDTGSTLSRLAHILGDRFEIYEADIRDGGVLDEIFTRYGTDIRVVIHAAGQPSGEWSLTDPLTDFAVNATGTLNLLELTRRHSPDAVFVYCSTTKVYGDNPNQLSFLERDTRYDLLPGERYYDGITETMSTDNCIRSMTGVSHTAADTAVVEYARHFKLKTATFRCASVTGVAHAATQHHGFLAYLMRCALEGRTYNVFGYQGKQVRDVLCCHDLTNAFALFAEAPRSGGQIYNIGGGRDSHTSVHEAVLLAGKITGRHLRSIYVDRPRVGDPCWWITNTLRFRQHYPQWKPTRNVEQILTDMYNHHVQTQHR